MEEDATIRQYVEETLESLRDTTTGKVDERLLLLFFLQELKSISNRMTLMEEVLFGKDKR